MAVRAMSEAKRRERHQTICIFMKKNGLWLSCKTATAVALSCSKLKNADSKGKGKGKSKRYKCKWLWALLGDSSNNLRWFTIYRREIDNATVAWGGSRQFAWAICNWWATHAHASLPSERNTPAKNPEGRAKLFNIFANGKSEKYYTLILIVSQRKMAKALSIYRKKFHAESAQIWRPFKAIESQWSIGKCSIHIL